MRELLRAVTTGKPIITLLEPETKRGGMTMAEISAALLDADAPTTYSQWGLTAEVKSWGYHFPTGEQLNQSISSADAIEWNRIGFFQACDSGRMQQKQM